MAIIKKFTLENFKGVKLVEIDLKRTQIHPVVTLLGLNETGKTTILEGLSKFVTYDSATKDIFRAEHSSDTPSSFIPKHQEAGFTGDIKISASIELDEQDMKALTEELKDSEVGKFDLSDISDCISVTATYSFEDSDLVKEMNYWGGVDLEYVPTGKRKQIEYIRPKAKREKDYWSIACECLSARVPKITYFPSFLVDVPERIYLCEFDGEDAINRYYRTVLQDVLSSTDGTLSLDKHIVKRIQDYKKEAGVDTWVSSFLGTDKKKQVDAVFAKMSSSISKEIIGNWAKIFQRPTEAKNISFNWAVDAEKGDIPYASFVISDGESIFEVNQRSLGFRWFFSFLLFTRFRKGKDRATIFLFDEPAANLHAKAQVELLASFGRIVEDGNQIVYSTHSHHMIEPKWLSGAYIVENLAIDYDASDSLEHFSPRPTEIVATRYRNFISQSSERSSYYLPVLEKLQYVVPSVVDHGNVVVVEGISDYHLFRYVAERRNITNITFVPGISASNMGPLLSLMVGLSRKFVILLDDDHAGRKERDRYRVAWSLNDNDALTIGDLDSTLEGKQLETLLSEDSKNMIKEYFSVEGSLKKKQIQSYLAESVSTGESLRISEETMDKVESICKQLSKLIFGAVKEAT